MSHTRFNQIGIGGNAMPSDAFIHSIEVDLPIVAASTAQLTDFTFPFRAKVLDVTINVLTGESTGTTKVVSLGFDGGSETVLAATVSIASAGLVSGTPQVVASGETLTYRLGSSNFAEFDATAIIHYIGID